MAARPEGPAALEVSLLRLAHAAALPLPERASTGSAGFDLRAAISETFRLEPAARTLVPTGFVWQIPAGWEGQVRPRSGLALRHGVTVLNAPGTIDSDYRGEVAVLLVNLGSEPFPIEPGDRIAQLVLAPVASAHLSEAPTLTETDRGAGGFGSTGRG
jgi:dUTP pyrophosphatase